MTKIAVALAWFDEPLEFLDRLTRSVAPIASTLVAFDGRWQHMPGRADLSAPEQLATIQKAGHEAGIEIVAHLGVWQSQVHKRAALMREAAHHGDWIVVLDADEHVIWSDPSALLRTLADTDKDVGSIHCTRVCPQARTRERIIRRVYRASTGVTVIRWHNGYVTADGRWLHGRAKFVDREPLVPLQHTLRIQHNMLSRGRERNLAMRAYYGTRTKLRLEA